MKMKILNYVQTLKQKLTACLLKYWTLKMSDNGKNLVADRYPQDFVQEPCKVWVTRSTTNDEVVLSLWESDRYTAHSGIKNWGHGDGLIHLGGLDFALGTKYEVLPFKVTIKGNHLALGRKTPYKVSGENSSENILLGNGFGKIVVMTKYPDTTRKRVRTADQVKFFSSTKYSGIGKEMFDTDWDIYEGAVQGVGFIDPDTIVVISGGADVAPRVKTYDVLTGTETVHPRINTDHINGNHIEAEGYDQGHTMLAYRNSSGVQFDIVPVLP